jgi:Fungal specific transcription factor domain
MLRGTTLELGKPPFAFDYIYVRVLLLTTEVQFLLLMGQYLQGTQKYVQAWTMHGLAVKAALQLGLHSQDASGVFSPAEQEVRKRTWYGCVVLDRYEGPILSSASNLPTKISL